MKSHSILLGTILMTAITPAFAQTTPGMQMGRDTHATQMQKAAQSTGVIKAIDTAKGSVTIQHQAIESIHWPAMTMTFKADPPSLLNRVKVGEKVHFTLHPDGMHSTVTTIAPAQ